MVSRSFWWVAVVLAVLGILGYLGVVAALQMAAFWLIVIAFVFMAVASLLRRRP